jgi:hypothetical protein
MLPPEHPNRVIRFWVPGRPFDPYGSIQDKRHEVSELDSTASLRMREVDAVDDVVE